MSILSLDFELMLECHTICSNRNFVVLKQTCVGRKKTDKFYSFGPCGIDCQVY